ncbi:hypothetical protein A2U01_0011700, partial [Trifolium medium]|nr:hypothetical protein [Trifolium medium]
NYIERCGGRRQKPILINPMTYFNVSAIGENDLVAYWNKEVSNGLPKPPEFLFSK